MIYSCFAFASLSSPTIREGARKYAVSTSQVWHLATESMILSTRKHIVYEALEKNWKPLEKIYEALEKNLHRRKRIRCDALTRI